MPEAVLGIGRELMESMQAMAFVVDDDVRILEANAAALRLLGESRGDVVGKRGGEALHCIYADDNPGGCGRSRDCLQCLIRGSVNECLAGREITRRRSVSWVEREGRETLLPVLVSTRLLEESPPRVLLTLEPA